MEATYNTFHTSVCLSVCICRSWTPHTGGGDCSTFTCSQNVWRIALTKLAWFTYLLEKPYSPHHSHEAWPTISVHNNFCSPSRKTRLKSLTYQKQIRLPNFRKKTSLGVTRLVLSQIFELPVPFIAISKYFVPFVALIQYQLFHFNSTFIFLHATYAVKFVAD